MRLHTNLTREQVTGAADSAQERAPGITVSGLTEHTSRSHPRAFEIQLRLRANGRKASWDNWGWFIAEVFKADPAARFANIYDGVDDFDFKTTFAFADMSSYYPEDEDTP